MAGLALSLSLCSCDYLPINIRELTEVGLGGDGDYGRGEGQPRQEQRQRLEGARVGHGEGEEVAVRLGQRARHGARVGRLREAGGVITYQCKSLFSTALLNFSAQQHVFGFEVTKTLRAILGRVVRFKLQVGQ